MPQVKFSDADVIRCVHHGDRDAYRILVDRYAPMVFRILRRYCHDGADVEDLAQDTFVRAYQNLDRFRQDAQFSSWLYRIAVNRGKDFVKSARQRRFENGVDEHLEQNLTMTTTPYSQMVGNERAALVHKAIDELGPEYATPFLLKYEAGLPYKDIAVMLDTTVGALKVRVHRARKQLRTYLEDRL